MNETTENKLKSIFLPALIIYAVLVTIGGIAALLSGANSSIWLGVIVSAITVILYFGRLYVVRVPRTTPGLMGFSFSIFGTTMYSIFQSYDQQVASIAPIFGMICLAGWVGYVTWYSELGDRSKDKIKEGKRLPKINLEDYEGNKLSSDDWKGQKRLVIFYRGNWCPICTAQIKELGDFKQKFEELGVKITLISPQPHQQSRKHANRVGMGSDFFVDVNNSAARTLGIVQEHGLPAGFQAFGYDADVPKPTTFVLDENGKVVFADLTSNYRLRTMPQDIIKALEN